MDIKKALYISQEISPYLPSSVLADMGRNLPQGIQEKGIEVRTFMPKYGSINERRNQLHEVIRLSGLNIVIDDTDHPLIIKVATLQPTRMQVYFIDNDDYFHRQGSEGLEIDTEPEDNDERSMFFVRGVIETVKKLRWLPQIVHCSGWASALAPIYIRRMYEDDPTLRECKIIYSIHNSAPVQPLDVRMPEKLIMDGFNADDLKHLSAGPIDEVALGKLAIDFSDAVVQAEGEVNAELVEYAKASGKPFLAYPGEENFIDKYHEFYLSL
jgi:starch synthase